MHLLAVLFWRRVCYTSCIETPGQRGWGSFLSAMLPDQVLALVAAAFPDQPIGEVTPTEGGFSHQTALATIGTRRCAIKAATDDAKRADVRHEARMLGLLNGYALPNPELLALRESDAWTVTISAAIGGRNGIHLYQQPQLLAYAYHELGELLAGVHRTPIAPPDPRLLLAERLREVQEQLPALGLEPELRDVFASSLAHPSWQPESPRLVHGDAGLHNVLWDGRISALLDWEWSGWGNPPLDVAWVYWTMRWRAVAPVLWDTFLSSYQAAFAEGIPTDSASLRALVFGQIAGILVRSRNQPAARAEWLRRANWTLTLQFPEPRP
jgi:aminoglycoside phosphotransferase (APT) family kinase protein